MESLLFQKCYTCALDVILYQHLLGISCKAKNNSLDCVTFSSSKFDKSDIFSENIIGVEVM